jgi:hypothetical protein
MKNDDENCGKCDENERGKKRFLIEQGGGRRRRGKRRIRKRGRLLRLFPSIDSVW